MNNNSLDRNITALSVLKFTFPSIAMMIVMSLYTVVDGVFVSRLVGTDAFSSVNIIYPLSSFGIGLGTMFGAGTAAIVSQKLGQGRQDEANRLLTFIILVAVGLGVAITAVSLIFLEPIVYMLGANAEIFQYCRDYALPIICFFTANIMQFPFQNLYVADGRPHIGLIITTAGGLTNVVLDYIFMAKLNMGVTGAAVATGIGCSVPAVFGLVYFSLNRKGSLFFTKPKADIKALVQALINGSSEMVSYLSASVTTFLFNIIMMQLVGQDGVAAIAIILYLDFVMTAVSFGYSLGIAPMISYNYGLGDYRRLKKLFRLSAIFCTAVGVVMFAGTATFSRVLASVFTTKGTAVYELTVTGLGIYAFGYLFKGYNIFSSAMFTAYGNGKVSAVLSFLRTLVFLVGSLIGLSVLFGTDGVWYSSPVTEILSLAVAIYFTVKHRQKYYLY